MGLTAEQPSEVVLTSHVANPKIPRVADVSRSEQVYNGSVRHTVPFLHGEAERWMK